MRELDRQQQMIDDRRAIEAAARLVRRAAAQAQRSGLRPEVSFSYAALLDELALQLRVLPDAVRRTAVRTSQYLCQKLNSDD